MSESKRLSTWPMLLELLNRCLGEILMAGNYLPFVKMCVRATDRQGKIKRIRKEEFARFTKRRH